MIECIDRKTFFSEHPAARLYTAREHQWGYKNIAEDAPRYAEEEEKELPRIAALLPPGCELIVNHQTYRREKPGEGYAY